MKRKLGKYILKLSTIRRQKMEYKIGDQELSAAAFIGFANKVWPGKYDEEKTAAACLLCHSTNIYPAYFCEWKELNKIERN